MHGVHTPCQLRTLHTQESVDLLAVKAAVLRAAEAVRLAVRADTRKCRKEFARRLLAVHAERG